MKLSAYFTTRNAEQMRYPFQESIRSTFNSFDEIVVCDTSDNKDNTKEVLDQLAKEFGKEFKIITPDFIDWEAKNSGIYDGVAKATARKYCTGDYLWQQDIDEILEENAKEKILNVIKQADLNEELPLAATPVIEFWGSKGKVRIDTNPWKWRISKNYPWLTHGIPSMFRKQIDGLLYAQHGTDGCNFIDKRTNNEVKFLNFIKPEVEQVRRWR